ncbi:MAG TPA: extracellular solute-binding protein [Patescibacteria group bacterium]|nr:extracellular solute-binding protein [Patescibacteria group bacterium]
MDNSSQQNTPLNQQMQQQNQPIQPLIPQQSVPPIPEQQGMQQISQQPVQQAAPVGETIPPEVAALIQEPSVAPVRRDTPQIPPPPPPDSTVQKSTPLQQESGHGFPKPLLITLGALVVFAGILIIFSLLKSFFGNVTGGSGKVTITYWGLWEDANVMQPLIADFEKQHPTITVDYEKQDPNQYAQRLLVRSQQGNGPDIFRYHISWADELSQILLPLPSDIISKDDLDKNYYPVVKQDLVKNGALYGIPLEMDTLALFVNNTLLGNAKAQVPSTWDDFVTVAKALTQKNTSGQILVAGASIGTFDNVTHAPDIVSLLFLQNGVDLKTITPAQNASDALQFYTSFASGNNPVWSNNLDNSELAFSKGNVAMYFGYSWDIFSIQAANPNLNFSVHPVPHLPGRNNTVASYWVEGVSAKSKHQSESLLFMKYLAQKDTLTKLYTEEAKTRAFGELYPRSDFAGFLQDNQLLYPFLKQATNAQSSLFAGDTYDTTGMNAKLNQYLGGAVRGVLGNTSPETAVQTLTQGVSQVLSQYGQ